MFKKVMAVDLLRRGLLVLSGGLVLYQFYQEVNYSAYKRLYNGLPEGMYKVTKHDRHINFNLLNDVDETLSTM